MKSNRRVSQCGDDGALFQYGPRTGCRSFKVQMAKFLSEGYEDEVREENLGEQRRGWANGPLGRDDDESLALQFSLAGPQSDCGWRPPRCSPLAGE